jgi:hypothetical protein
MHKCTPLQKGTTYSMARVLRTWSKKAITSCVPVLITNKKGKDIPITGHGGP